jgi:hypothetical protein
LLAIDSYLVVYFEILPLILLVMLPPLATNGMVTGQPVFMAIFNRVPVGGPEGFAMSPISTAPGIVGHLPREMFHAFDGTRSHR